MDERSALDATSAADRPSAAERATPCPRCGEAIGLTAAQLEDKRGRCGACGAAVELDADSPLTDAGAGAPVALARVLAQRPGRALVVRRRTPLTIAVRVPGALPISILALVAAAGFAWMAIAMASLAGALTLAPFIAVLTWLGVTYRPRWTEVGATPRRLWVRGRLWRRRELAVTAPLQFAHDGAELVAASGDAAIVLAPVALDPDDRRWLRDALRAAAALPEEPA